MKLLERNDELFYLQKRIFILKDYQMCLRKRLYLIKNNYALKTEYEKNEIEIVTYQTRVLIAGNVKTISLLEEQLDKETDDYIYLLGTIKANCECQ